MSKRGRNRGKRIFRTVAVTLGLLFLAVFVTAAVFVGITASRAPQISALDAVPKGYRSTVLDDDGNVILNLSKEGSNRVYVKLEEIPEVLQHAFVAVEDERFYRHHGVDLRGILRAFWRGITGGGFTEGASTITQQLLKNNVFPAWTEEVGFFERLERKIQEQYLALKLERSASKEWILENYLNTINLGGGSYGVETAARRYFGKDVSDLTLSESAVLAGITKNPTQFDPLLDQAANAERREMVLEKMVEQGYVSREEADEALADPVYERIAAGGGDGGIPVMSYFEDELVNAVVGDLKKTVPCTEEEAWEMLYTGGLTIRSTQDSSLQEICEQAVARDDLVTADAQVAVVMIDNATGQVKAVIGGRGEKDGSLLLNRATMGIDQPASAIKVIGEYAAALEQGAVTLGTTFDDAPCNYDTGEPIQNAAGTYGGMTTVRDSIASSNNIVALKVFREVGREEVLEQLADFGISTLQEEEAGEALAIGATGGGVSDLEMTAAYSAIARGGEYREPVYYTEVTDRSGEVILSGEQAAARAVRLQTAELLTSAMEDVIQSGTATRAGFAGMHLAGKSGTSEEARDLWFVGFSPYVTCGIWGGRDDNGAQENTNYVQDLWRVIMQETHTGLEDREFADSGTLVSCEICTKCGRRAVQGLCEHADHGNAARTELFAPGTEPKSSCSCHVEVEVCTSSGQQAGRYCRDTETHVYLRTATEGTSDEAYLLPEGLAVHSCEEHDTFWSSWARRQEEETQWQREESASEEGQTSENAAEETAPEEGSSWWESLFHWFGGY